MYFPAVQFFFFDPGSLVVRTASAPETLVPAIREAIRAQEPHAALASVSTMDALLARELSRPRTALTVTALFALMAIVLAAVGVYGVMSYEVIQRRRELAVRSALGASPSRLFKTVVLRSLALGAAGTALGLVAASFVTRSLGSLLFEVVPGDPSSFVIGVGVLLGIVLLASLVPARRAAAAEGLEITRISRPKQTDTTQRWKIELKAAGVSVPLHTKVEFSRRGTRDEEYALEPVRPDIVRPYGIPAPTANHYTARSAIRQKIQALAGRSETQARDVWDLDHLIRTTNADPRPLQRDVRALLPEAVERALSLGYDMFKAQVVPYLSAEDQTVYGTRDAWDRMCELVAERLEEFQS